MFYTPAIAIPGKVAHLKMEDALAFAYRVGTYVMDDNFDVAFSYQSAKSLHLGLGQAKAGEFADAPDLNDGDVVIYPTHE